MDEHCWDYMDRSGLLHLDRELGVQPNDRSRQLAGAEFQIPLETVQTLSERLGCLDEEGGSGWTGDRPFVRLVAPRLSWTVPAVSR